MTYETWAKVDLLCESRIYVYGKQMVYLAASHALRNKISVITLESRIHEVRRDCARSTDGLKSSKRNHLTNFC